MPLKIIFPNSTRFRNLGFCILLFLFSNCFGQQFNFTNFGLEDGLPQSTIYDIFQDRDDYLWLGTDGGGLCRYDGYRFKTFGKSDGLESTVIRKITQDADRTIWVATWTGLYYIKDNVVKSFDQIENNKSLIFMSVFSDSKQNIWAATSGKGVYKIRAGKIGYTVEQFTTEQGLSSDYIFDVCEDGSGKIWFAHFQNGLDIYDYTSKKFANLKLKNSDHNQVISLRKTDDKHIAFGTKSAGAFLINSSRLNDNYNLIPGTLGSQVWSICNGAEGLWVATDNSGVVNSNPLYTLSKNKGLITNKIFKVFVDREKNTWIGTSNAGLIKFSGNCFTHVTNESNGLPQVSAVVKEKENSIWLGTANGLYNFGIDDTISLLKRFDAKSGLPSNDITSISKGRGQSLWIGTRSGISMYNGIRFRNYAEPELVGNNVNSILCDSKNRIWIGTSAGLSMMNEERVFSNMSESNGLVNNEVQCIFEDRKGNIWLGTLGGLVKYDGKQLYTFNEEDGLSVKKIQSLCEDRFGRIYIGTLGGGLFYFTDFTINKKSIREVCKPEVLVSDNIYGMTFQNDSTLIVASNNGLNKITLDSDGQGTSVVYLGQSKGFKFLENSLNAVLKTNKGIWFGTTKGVSIYHPEEDKINLIKPLIRITGLSVNSENKSFQNTVHLHSDENSLKARLVSISLTNPEHNTYYVKLLGLDAIWSKLLIDKQNLNDFLNVEYKGLQPGNYQLLLKSKNNDGIESDTVQIKLVIAPPFYKRAWFIILCLIIFLVLVFLFFKYRERILIKEKEKLEVIVTERTAEVVASKKEIEAQKDLLQIQKHEITDSINYSKRIQNAILPDQNALFQTFERSFILYKPKDIVSGDFYFFDSKQSETFYIAVADCTGHGVPGAFMSMIGSKELTDAVHANDQPSSILRSLNIGMRKTLKQTNLDIGIKDGMDIALITIQPHEKEWKLSYAGANRPLWIIKNEGCEIIETKATKTAIGGYTLDEQIFEQHEVILNSGDAVYLFSDGYADQFGGELGKKMMTKRFKELLLESKSFSMAEQGEHLKNYFDNWKGSDNEQVDDVLVIGVRV